MSADGAAPKVVEMKTGGEAPATAVAAPSRPAPAPAPAPSRGRRRYLIMAAVPAILLAAGAWLWLASGRYVSTDNAYVQQDRVTITSNVSGRIVEAAVMANDPVKAGEVLFRIDPEPYRITLEGAEAALSSARLQVEQLRTAYQQAQTEEKIAVDDVAFKQKTFDRQQGLLAKGISSQASFDEAENDLHTAEQSLSQAKQRTQAALAALGNDPTVETDNHPLVQAALAKTDQAQLDLKDTEIDAPADGVVAQAERLQVGQYVTVGTPILAIVENGNSWVEANFKETDLAVMSVGDKATVHVDAYPGKTFAGVVDSIGAGTGAEFSLLPAQNATGNWVKVVQRVPVKIRFTEPVKDVPLRVGLSASVEVDTGPGTGAAAAGEAGAGDRP
jgi:membrane fusion protein, multidrug efflux system